MDEKKFVSYVLNNKQIKEEDFESFVYEVVSYLKYEYPSNKVVNKISFYTFKDILHEIKERKISAYEQMAKINSIASYDRSTGFQFNFDILKKGNALEIFYVVSHEYSHAKNPMNNIYGSLVTKSLDIAWWADEGESKADAFAIKAVLNFIKAVGVKKRDLPNSFVQFYLKSQIANLKHSLASLFRWYYKNKNEKNFKKIEEEIEKLEKQQNKSEETKKLLEKYKHICEEVTETCDD